MADKLGRPAPISLRINPNIDAKIATGLYSTKFGMREEEARGKITCYKFKAWYNCGRKYA
jgi:diaminopimelate decarboxylase